MILVTGGAGFIGSHTCKALSQAGFEPVVFDNLSMGHRHNVRWGPLVVGDVSDTGVLWQVFRRFPIEGVLHFAASAYVGESVSNPLKYYRNNLVSTLSLLEVLTACGTPPLVFSSSCATYGIPETIPVQVTHGQSPVNPYGRSKLAGEQMILDAGRAHGLRSAILRYFNAAGADPEGELREEHDPETHLIPLAIDAALGKGPPLQVFGSDYPTPDGSCIRDFIHVTDLAGAHVRALRELMGGGAGFIRNLGTGTGYSVKEIIRAVGSATGLEVPHTYCPRREGDPPALIADAGTESAQFRYSSLDTIVETALLARN